MRGFEVLEHRRLMAADFSVSVNFQPEGTPRVPKMQTDYGYAYGLHRGGLSYGWDRDMTGNAVDRNVTAVQKNDTYMVMPRGATWEMAVPDGQYRVYVVAGDPAHAGSRMALAVEGTLAVAGITRKAKLFLEGPVDVSVTDGALTLKAVGEFGADKINYLSVEALGGASVPDTTPSVPTAPVVTNRLTWATGKKEAVPTTEPESAVVNDKLYVFSGYGDKSNGGDGWQPSNKIQRYDPATGTFAVIGTMPIGTTHAGTAVVGTDIWFAGGYTARAGTTTKQDITSTNVWVYHTTTNTWSTGPALPARRASGGMALVNNKLFYVSGEPIDHHNDVTTVYALDLARTSAGWSSVASIPEGRSHFGISVVNGKIYVIGGHTHVDYDVGFPKTNYAYDPAANKWTRLADMPSPHSFLASSTFTLGTKIYAFGGANAATFSQGVNLSTVYDTATNTFSALTPLPAGRRAGAAGYVGGHVVFTGGNYGSFFSDTYVGTFA